MYLVLLYVSFALLVAGIAILALLYKPARVRLADRRKWPRSWWWPLPQEFRLSAEDWEKQHDETSETINRLLVVLIGFGFFCVLALGASDRSLLASDAEITLPFANTKVGFTYFLLIGPLVLTGLSFYLHIFVGHWSRLLSHRLGPSSPNPELPHPPLPFIFNLESRTASWLSHFLFYWLVPVILSLFAWKALPRPEGPLLVVLACAFFWQCFSFFSYVAAPIHIRLSHMCCG